MLIKLPNSIIAIADLQELLESLEVKSAHRRKIVQDFLTANPRLDIKDGNSKLVLDYLREMIASPKKATMSFAQPPDQSLVNEITQWLRVNVDEHIVMEIKQEPMLIGGFVLRTPQRVYDFSWNKVLDPDRSVLKEMMLNAG